MKILILKESDLRGDKDSWIHLTKSRVDIERANIVILLKNDGTYQPVKNIYGSSNLVGVIGEPLNLTIQDK